MQMMRGACIKLINKGGDIFKKLKRTDGWRESVELREYSVQEDYDIMIAGDIEEAYTNINDIMIKNAIRTVCKVLEVVEWKIELMTKMVDLILEQNYVETSGGLYKFRKVLPMGYKMSGEALDIVALADEMMVLYDLGKEESKKIKIGIGELKSYPPVFVDNDVQRELSMARGVRSISRYVDDILIQVAGTVKEIQDGILAIGYTYPENLTISMNLNIWNSSHLDVFMWKNLLDGSVSTVLKRNGDVPVGNIRRGSSHPEMYKLQSLLGEMLRGRRIASDEELFQLSDKCLAFEFQSIGYSRREVDDAMEKAKKRFDEKYSQMFVKIPDDDGDERRYFKYGGGIVYNKNYRYAEVVLNYIDKIKPEDEPGIRLLTDVKVKRLAYTKKRYLEGS